MLHKHIRFSCFLILSLVLLSLLIVPALSMAEGSAVLNDTVQFGNGYVVVSWSGSPSAEYDIYYQFLDPLNGEEQPQQWDGAGRFNTYSIGGMVPGHSYGVYLVDPATDLILDYKEYELPGAETFRDGKLKDTSVKVSIDPRKQTADGSVKSVSEITAKNIVRDLENGSAQYGFRYTMKMPQLIKNRSFHVQTVITAPNGMIWSTNFGDVTFERVADGYQTLWSNFTGNAIFYYEYDRFGNVPAGKYQVELYWDGMFVNRSTITVK